MYQCQVSLGSLPVSIVILSSGELVFIKTSASATIIDQAETVEKIGAIFDEEGFSLGNTNNLHYNTKYSYKDIPDMLKWLQQQKIPHPMANGEYIND